MDFIQDVMAGRVKLPMVPRVVERVLSVIRKPDASFADVTEELEQDPVLSSRVLRLANSSFFGGRRSLASIEDAVSTVGLNSLQTLLIASGAMAAFVEVPAVNLRQFWMVSVISASSARQIAARADVNGEMAYCAGLLQGVGHLILCQSHPDEALGAMLGYRTLWGQELALVEAAAFGVTHPMISAIWADRLGLPREVVAAIRYSLEPIGGAAPNLGRVVQLASNVAASVSAGVSVEDAIGRVDMALVQRLNLETYVSSGRFSTDFDELQTLSVPL
ncbi:HDOD domain-containing protein [Variovorax sp. RHLX14]|uniref:HDOD domain-containing protein n=1 Tax=Variovorax sp. RHLX14 TaxID=1259731 RepID=UPI003F45C3CB